MYKLIGADGKEYGPITIDQVRQWIAEGRAAGQTLISLENTSDWRPLTAYPELATLLPPPSPVGPPPVQTTALAGNAEAEVLAVQIRSRDYRLDVGNCLGRGWELVKTNFWLLVGAGFVIMLLNSMAGIIGGPLMAGLYWLNLKLIRKKSADLGDVFAGFSMTFLPLFLGFIVIALLGTIGLLFCLVPGIYLFVSWTFALPLIIDQKMDFWPAMELSRKVVGQHWWKIFWLLLACGLVTVMGLFFCFIGVLVTGPIATAAQMYAYEDIFHPASPQAAPPA